MAMEIFYRKKLILAKQLKSFDNDQSALTNFLGNIRVSPIGFPSPNFRHFFSYPRAPPMMRHIMQQ